MDNNLTLNAIQPLVVINEHSLFYAIVLFSILGVILIVIVYFTYYRFVSVNLNTKMKKKESYELIMNLDMSDTRRSAYTLSIEGFKLLKNKKQIDIYNNMNIMLKKYKYTQDIKSIFDDEVLREINQFIKVIK